MGDNPADRQSFGRLWLNRGIAAARAGKRAEAREALFRALNDESQREMAWLWLAAVADDARQERMYLEKVLSLNPDNRYARAGLAQLKEKGRASAGPPAELPGGAASQPNAPTAAQSDSATASASEVGQPAPGAASARQAATEVAPQARPGGPAGPSRPTAPPAPAQPASRAVPAAENKPKSRQHRPSTGPTAAVEQEPTGWTTDWPVAPPRQDRPQPPPVARSAERWDDWRDKLLAPQQPQVRAMPAPRHRRPRSVPPDTLLDGHGRLASIVNEAFNSHEMWTILASALSLVLLGFVLAFFFALSLFTP